MIGENNKRSDDISDDAIEFDKILHSLSHKERTKLMSLVYDWVDDLKKELTQHFIRIDLQQNFTAIGVNNTLSVTPQNASIYLTSIKINLFNSKQGVFIYGLLAFIIIIAWIICFTINLTGIFVSFALIPFVFFALRTSYFKYHDDFYHLKIHKTLLYIVIATIISIFLLSVLYIEIKLNVQNIAMIVIAIRTCPHRKSMV